MLIVSRRMLKGEGEDRGPLTADEIDRVNSQALEYVQDPSPEAVISFGGSMLFINAAFRALKQAARGHLLVAAKGHTSMAAKGRTMAPGIPDNIPVGKLTATAMAAPQDVQQLTDQVTHQVRLEYFKEPDNHMGSGPCIPASDLSLATH